MAAKEYTYTVQIEPAEEGGFNVFVPALPGCYTQADTFEEAVERAKECIEGFLEALVKAGQAIPVENHPRQPVSLGIQVRLPQKV
jgi:antitoxin HicB